MSSVSQPNAIQLSSIQLKNISQSFTLNEAKVTLFEQLNLIIKQGQSYAITGPSGAGNQVC